MNGAESLVYTLLKSGVDTCFANPGMSELHFVSALDRARGMRCVLNLFEGVVTGCADGYARMADRPAATLLHCGPGLANGLANLHNARRASSPIVNIVGDQATYHRPLDSNLTADTEGWARPVSAWVRTTATAAAVGSDAAVAVQAARTAPGQIATLILPADTAWSDGGIVADPLPVPPAPHAAPNTVKEIASLLRNGEPAMLFLGRRALRTEGLEAAHRIAAATGVDGATGKCAHRTRARPDAHRASALSAGARYRRACRYSPLDLSGRSQTRGRLRLPEPARLPLSAGCRRACSRPRGTGPSASAAGSGGRNRCALRAAAETSSATRTCKRSPRAGGGGP